MKKNLFIYFLLIHQIGFGQDLKTLDSNEVNDKMIYSEFLKIISKAEEKAEKKIVKFDSPISLSLDSTSQFYFKRIENKLANLDTTLTAEQLMSYRNFKISNDLRYNYLDTICVELYKYNEKKEYQKAIDLAKIVLIESPNNITGHKEIALAYEKIGNKKLSVMHFNMMKKIILSTYIYGDGSYDFPLYANNFFEGLSILEAFKNCLPQRLTLMLDKKERVLGVFNCKYEGEILNIELSQYKSTLSTIPHHIEK